jgi:predicted peroxiredoxin
MPTPNTSSLNLIILTEEPERFRGGLLLALSMRALGRDVQIFLQLEAVRVLGAEAPHDSAHQDAGLPTLGEMIGEALASGVGITACQTGLHLTGQSAASIDSRIRTGGLLSFLAGVEAKDRLLTI